GLSGLASHWLVASVCQPFTTWEKEMAARILTLVLNLGLLACASWPVCIAAPPHDARTLMEGSPLPTFESLDDQGQPWKSAEHTGKKGLVLYFEYGDFTGGCTRQAQAYRDALAKIEQLGAEVVGVSGDEVATHKLFKETYGLTHSLLADPQGKLAKTLDV